MFSRGNAGLALQRTLAVICSGCMCRLAAALAEIPPMIRGRKTQLLVAISLLALVGALVRADVPKPSPYPISWELKFDHATPRRILVKVPGEKAQRAFWYMTFTVTNNTGQERQFYPAFELMTGDGTV